jgi:hypothetical protein
MAAKTGRILNQYETYCVLPTQKLLIEQAKRLLLWKPGFLILSSRNHRLGVLEDPFVGNA